VFAAFFCFLLHRNRQSLDLMQAANAPWYLSLFGLCLFALLIQGLINVVCYSTSNKPISISEGYDLAVLNTLGNFLPFSGGLIAKGWILKRRFQVAYTRYAAITLYVQAASAVTSGLVGFACLAFMDTRPWPLLFAFAGLTMGGAATILFLPTLVGWMRNTSIFSKIHILANLPNHVPSFRQYSFRTFVCQGLLMLCFGWLFQVSFCILGLSVGLHHTLLLAGGLFLSRLFPFLPGGVGIAEAVTATLAGLTGVSVEMSILAVGIIRLVFIFVVFSSFLLRKHDNP
jgi:uncharacterized membrane protein YbhN (UPF0104 family)